MPQKYSNNFILFFNVAFVLEYMEKGKVKEFVINLKDEIHEDPYINGSSNHDSQFIYEKV